VFAHEIGHYVLATPQHTSSGLMRARFAFEELLEGADHFDLDPNSRQQRCR
jgi:hypothetical protein